MFKLNIINLLYMYAITNVLSTVASNKLIYRGIIVINTIVLLVILFTLIQLSFKVFLLGYQIINELTLISNTWLGISISIVFQIDTLSYLFLLLVIIIGLHTNIYILGYLKYEANIDTFCLLINWFILSMCILILGGNLFTIFLGWELIGLTSFFLINFWYNRRGTNKSSFKAFTFNKCSDLLLLIFIVLIIQEFHTTNVSLINFYIYSSSYIYSYTMNILTIALIGCASFKSAQLIGHLWLPDSMEAPVPASALIHSATLVSAGIYLLLRFYQLLNITELTNIVIIVGICSGAYGGVVSAAQTDMKRLLAYSTISHCGFMFTSIGIGIHSITIVYLYLHGLFKALTFFCVGSLIRINNSQELRQAGHSATLNPVEVVMLILSGFNLGGLPLMCGFFYKKIFLISTLSISLHLGVNSLLLVGLLVGIIYIYRLIYYSGFDYFKGYINIVAIQLEQKPSNNLNRWLTTTLIFVIASTSMYTITFIVYSMLNHLLINEFIIYEVIPIQFKAYTLELDMWLPYLHDILIIYYLLYLFIIVTIMSVITRIEYRYIFKITFIIYTIFNIIVYNGLVLLKVRNFFYECDLGLDLMLVKRLIHASLISVI